ncbi:MAG: quinolinate synthase NadA [Ruminococcaceae bacterium]|nr:quinolinate synthase NadA [Oscillospiraceae bacterium]
MQTVYALQQEILRLKKEHDIAILAHSYQTHDILEVADLTGDSFALSAAAAKLPQKTVLMCGVRFMAETVKLLSPDKTVLLSASQAGCPMAEQMSKESIAQYRREHPDHAVVAYINTTAELKTVCDVCVTSSSAVSIVSKLPQKDVLFIPDCNLGAFVAAACPDKNVILMKGGCPVHTAVTPEEAAAAKAAHPDALLLCHPECLPAVTAQADMAGSTADIMRFARESDRKEFIIGTENSIVEHLQYECPDKRFYPMSKGLICTDMKLTTLSDVYRAVSGDGGEEIVLPPETMQKARACIDRMLELG